MENGQYQAPYSKFALKEYVSRINSNIYETGQLRLMMVAKESGKTVGTVDLFDFDIHHSRVALGLFVAPQHQGKGFAKAALQLVESYVFNFLKNKPTLLSHRCKQQSQHQHVYKENFTKTKLTDWIKSESGFEDVFVFQQFIRDYRGKELSS